MRKDSRKKMAFRPDLNPAGLEERVVLSLPPGFNLVSQQQAAQFRAAFRRALQQTEFNVRSQIQAQARQLFANGTPTAQQIANFEANAQGEIIAGTATVANMLALLPGSQRRVISNTARALLSNNQNSLMSRIDNIVNNTNTTASLGTLQTALRQNIRAVFGNVRTQANQFVANQNLNRDVLFATDGSESLPQFIGDQITTQFANNLGNLALAFPNVGNSVLFANGATTATPAALQQFNQMVVPALGLAANTLGTELQLLPGGSTLIPALQNTLFGTTTTGTGTTIGTGTGTGIGIGTGIGTGTGTTTPASLIAALQGLPITSTDFQTAVPTAFSTGLANVTNILSPFVGTFPTPAFSLKTTATPGVFNSSFTGNSFQSGFLGGFGSGSVGFGMAPTAFNTNVGTGFNNFVSTTNPALGFFTPPISTGNGVVGTVGVSVGNGSTGTTTSIA